MAISNTILHMLDIIDRPAFLVQDKTVLHCNRHAHNLHIQTNTPIYALLDDNREIYDSFTDGCLQLQLYLPDLTLSATVEKLDNYQLFVAEQDISVTKLLTLAMASSQLRIPLTGLMNSIGPENSQANRLLCQLHRAVSNMADAMRYATMDNPQMRVFEMNAWLQELAESVNTHTASINLTLNCKTLQTPVYCPIEEELLKRAILNLISNSIKAGSTQIHMQLKQHKDMLSITLADNGKGISTEMRAEMFDRFKREPNYEDIQYGIGLGMMIVKAAAQIHRGTILTESNGNNGLRVTITISNRQDNPLILRSPPMYIDYLGGRDTVLTELSDVLPFSEY